MNNIRQDDNQTEYFEHVRRSDSLINRFIQYINSKVSRKTYVSAGQTSNILDSMPSNINRTLIFAKLFYFWYFAAFGSLFPLMSIYFKQMGMGPSYCGILMGSRPFVEFISAPFWSIVSTRFRQAKNILIMAILSWIIFTVALGLIQPPPHSCWKEMNSTHQIIERLGPVSSTPVNQFQAVSRTLLNQTKKMNEPKSFRPTTLMTTRRRKITKTIRTTTTTSSYDDEETSEEDDPIIEVVNNKKAQNLIVSQQDFSTNQNKKGHGNPLSIQQQNESLVKSSTSTIIYDSKDVRSVFLVFLLLIIIGEFFSAPAITLADACTLSYLGQDTELYGRQRMFGSLGWALGIFIVATILDQTKSLTFHPCGAIGPLEKNYTICFAAFSICMTFALFSASRFEFTYDRSEQAPLRSLNHDLRRRVTLVNRNTSPNAQQDQSNNNQTNSESTFSRSNTIKYMQVIQIFLSFKNATFLFIAWWMGFGVGLIFTFLFWHLQDLGGTATLFGVASVINHTSELFVYFFLHELIHRFGHIKILYLGLLGNFLRFVYISIISNPWWVLPFEFIQGLTHAAVWATACSYLSQAVPENLRISCQGILQGFHFGFGRGCGALFGGFFASYIGTDITFRVYGIICLIFMSLLIYINEYRRKATSVNVENSINEVINPMYLENQENFGNSPFLTPYGAPTNPKLQKRLSSGLTGVIRSDQYPTSIITSSWNQKTKEKNQFQNT